MKKLYTWGMGIVRKFYDWVMHWAYTPYAIPALVIFSFSESSVFPIPPDALLVPLVVSAPKKWWRFALWCTVASVLGGMAGYGIGMFAWKTVGIWIVENIIHIKLVLVEGRPDIHLPAYMIKIFGDGLGGEYLFQVYDRWNAWIVFIFGLTPLPYKLVTITAGVAEVNIWIFTLASIASRGLRFFVFCFILQKLGKQAKEFIDRYFNLVAIGFVLLIISGFALVKYLL